MTSNDPADRDPMLKGIIAAARAGNVKRAYALSRQLTERYPRSAGAWYLRGVLGVVTRQHGDASFALRKTLEIAPKLAVAHFTFAQNEAGQWRIAAAVPHLQRYVQLQPQDAIGWLALSDCTLQLGRKSEAVQHARRATAQAPSQVGLWIQLARTEKAVGNTSGTLAALKKAGELSPDNPALLILVGYGYINLDRPAEAIPPLTRAARLVPKDSWYTRNWATVCKRWESRSPRSSTCVKGRVWRRAMVLSGNTSVSLI